MFLEDFIWDFSNSNNFATILTIKHQAFAKKQQAAKSRVKKFKIT